MDTYKFKYEHELRKEENDKKHAKMQEAIDAKKANTSFKEFTLSVPTIIDTPGAIANIMSLIAKNKSFSITSEMVNAAILTGIDQMAEQDSNENPERAESLKLRYKKLLIMALRNSF